MPTSLADPDVETVSSAATTHPSTVVWINGRGALVASMDRHDRITTRSIDRGLESAQTYLRLVVEAIGDRERVIILGPNSVRLALEREYTSIHHRPDRLVDVEPAGLIDEDELVDRVREFAR